MPDLAWCGEPSYQEYLSAAPALLATGQPRRDYLCIVDNEQVAFVEQTCHFAETGFSFLLSAFVTVSLNSSCSITMKKSLALLVGVTVLACASNAAETLNWVSLFNGKDINNWKVRGKATWSVQNGVLVGAGGLGHIYTDVSCSDFEFKGMFRITELRGFGQVGCRRSTDSTRNLGRA